MCNSRAVRMMTLLAICFAMHVEAAVSRPFPLPGGTFEDHLDAWPLTSEYAIGPWGRDGGAALKCERTDQGYRFMGRPFSLRHGHAYKLGWWMKIVGTLPGEGAAVSVDWYAGGSWISFTMLKMVTTTNDEWIHYTGEFTAPSNPEFTFSLLAYLRNGTQGTVFFDDFTLEEMAAEASVYPLNVSNGRMLRGETMDVRVVVSEDVEISGLNVEWKDSAGRVALRGGVPVVGGHAMMDASRLPCGTYAVEMKLLAKDMDFPVSRHVITLVNDLSARVYIDSFGRCMVDGKPFMPLGWFVAGVSRNWEDGNKGNCSLDVLRQSPFNTIMPYNGVTLPGTTLKGFEAKREGLDACHEAGIMVVYSMKDYYPSDAPNPFMEGSNREAAAATVAALKDHPAILAWYTSDEMPRRMVPEILERRATVNRLDPDHPTWALFCSYADLPFFGGSYDVLGIDPYPFNSTADRGIFSVAQALEDTEKAALRANGTMALWAVPQAFNAALYSNTADVTAEEFFTSSRCPTAGETLAMALLHAIHGARGFLFYSDFDLRKSHESLRYDARWKELCEIGETLRELEPFIMSAIPHVKIPVKAAVGRVDAALMRTDSEKAALVIVSPLREGGQADIQWEGLPSGMSSKFGRTIESAPGLYRYVGAAADYDILMN